MMFDEQKEVKRLEEKAKRLEGKAKIQFNIVDAFIFLERLEDSSVKNELRNIFQRIDKYLEEI